VSMVSTTNMSRKARKQAGEIRRRAADVGGTIRRRAGDAGGTVRSRAGELGGTVKGRAGELGHRAAVRTKGARRSVGYWIAGEDPKKRRTGEILMAGVAGVVGAAAAFFLDPVSGKRRRHVARDWVAARFRRGGQKAGQAGRAVGARAYGTWRSATHVSEAGVPESDATLAHKVESEVFRGLDIPSGRVNINAEYGVITLRGAVDRTEQIEELELRTRRVGGVRDVENLLHLSGTSAPTT
jgi:gas vesicle protein